VPESAAWLGSTWVGFRPFPAGFFPQLRVKAIRPWLVESASIISIVKNNCNCWEIPLPFSRQRCHC
jgi:hypothetical protein